MRFWQVVNLIELSKIQKFLVPLTLKRQYVFFYPLEIDLKNQSFWKAILPSHLLKKGER